MNFVVIESLFIFSERERGSHDSKMIKLFEFLGPTRKNRFSLFECRSFLKIDARLSYLGMTSF